MNKQQIEEWIDENKQLVFVDENHAEHIIPMDKFRKLLKDNAIVPREPTDEMLESATRHHECVQGDPWYSNSEIPESDCADIYKAMIEASEKGE